MEPKYNLSLEHLMEAIMELSGEEERPFGPRTLARAIGRGTLVRSHEASMLKGGQAYKERHARADLNALVEEGILVTTENKKGRTLYLPNPERIVERVYESSMIY